MTNHEVSGAKEEPLRRELEAERKALEPAAVPERSAETVLVVEDDALVRELARSIIEMNDYEVLAARDGDEAVRICRTHAGPLHVVVTDVRMPGMSGVELAQRMAELRPGIKVLYLSGGPSEALLRSAGKEQGVAFLQKPFRPEELARKLREVLDAPSEGGLRKGDRPG